MKIIILILSITFLLMANKINISGKYKGTSEIKNNNYHIVLNNINTNKFSKYEDVYPSTAGNRAFLYFELNGIKGADIRGNIYRNVMILNAESKNGLYNIHIAEIPLKIINNSTIEIIFPKIYIKKKPIKIWTYQLYTRYIKKENNINISIKQNIRALYKGVNITQKQKDYLLDNLDENIKIINKSLKLEVKKLRLNYINEKNVISFKLNIDGTVSKVKFLRRSNNNKLDKATKQAISNIENNLIRPETETEIRYIISYKVGHETVKQSTRNNNNNIINDNRNIIIPISSGTTRFQHDSHEYVRTFTTSRDGFINLSVKPYACATFKLLTNNNQNVRIGMFSYNFNNEIMKGTYKLLIKTKKTCDVSLQYL